MSDQAPGTYPASHAVNGSIAEQGQWQSARTVPKDGTPFLFYQEEGMVFIGKYGQPSIGDVIEQPCLCYLSYTDTRGKNYFRLGAMIRCGFCLLGWMLLPEAPVSP